MSKVKAISGFPEWLPQVRFFEEQVIEKLRHFARLYGFLPIETASVEYLSTLEAKGLEGKEIYLLKRKADDEESKAGDDDSTLALHFDLTVPFARYTAQNLNNLVFPFKRYQTQKVWRGERPQKGRFREFRQFDFDIIARGDLPLALDAEVLSLVDKGFLAFNYSPHKFLCNSRRLLKAILKNLEIGDSFHSKVISTLDKLHKIGREKVKAIITEGEGVATSQADQLLEIVGKEVAAKKLDELRRELNLKSADELNELEEIFSLLPQETFSRCVINLSLARGLDYYSGMVFEVILPEFPQYGSLSSGGRYEDLASEFTNEKLPGVGGSIGITRLIALGVNENLIKERLQGSVEVVIGVYSEKQRRVSNELAEILRDAGLSCEVFYKDSKLGKQIELADKRGAKKILFLSEDFKLTSNLSFVGKLEAKDLKSGEQKQITSLKEIL
jgi:histidyl-tRNA synthetase